MVKLLEDSFDPSQSVLSS